MAKNRLMPSGVISQFWRNGLRQVLQYAKVCSDKPCHLELMNFVDFFPDLERGEVSELADEHDLGSCAEKRGGSSPPFPTLAQ